MPELKNKNAMIEKDFINGYCVLNEYTKATIITNEVLVIIQPLA